MCGIIGHTGQQATQQFLIEGLKRLEYRGYDSAGVAIQNGSIHLYKKKGNIAALEGYLPEKISGNCGIAHTRWATHGKPNNENAHPHMSYSKRLVMVHNGIIENYQMIKEDLMAKGITFSSDTDSEVLLNLIDWEFSLTHDLIKAIKNALTQVEGSYAIAIIKSDEPNTIYACRNGSPLILGEKDGEYFIASDALAINAFANQIYYPEDKDLAIVHASKGISFMDENGVPKKIESEELVQTNDHAQKKDFEDFMLKEIFEQPDSLRRSFIQPSASSDIDHLVEKVKACNRIIVLGCGTSWHAGLIGKYLIEKLARIPVEVEYASEFRYRHPVIQSSDLVLSISQSGETADTLAANRLARENNAMTLGICNVKRSTLTRETDYQLYLNAGAEIGVASTKAFTSQVSILTQLALFIAKERKEELSKNTMQALEALPAKIETVLKQSEAIKQLALKYALANHFLFIGRGVNYPVALEGALKLKEISYIHAEGYPGAEMKHGPIALIDYSFPTFAIVTDDENRSKMISNIKEIQARNGKVIALIQEGDNETAQVADEVISIPNTMDELIPILSTVPLQLFSYHAAKIRGCNVDQPRNLAKSVTVE
ncbi:glutamine--fructose-6-phosphate transaminase (isomerizing) [Prolixibacteraceae bacterium JC049]|nr:glutamine--fructose-6-phosphate transaminase (isomerizing) [Prolixibacteraceae bacterium JC049]